MIQVKKFTPHAFRDGLIAAVAPYTPDAGDAYMWRCKAALMGAYALQMMNLVASIRDVDDNAVFVGESDSLESANAFISNELRRRRLMDAVYDKHRDAVDEPYLDAWQFWADTMSKQPSPEQLALMAVWTQIQPEVRAHLAALH